MPIRTVDKLQELKNCQRTDGSVGQEYTTIATDTQKTKSSYKKSKEDVGNAEQKLESAKERFDNISMLEHPFKWNKARKVVKLAKADLKTKKQAEKKAKEIYKSKLSELRALKREVKGQYKAHRSHVKFFKRVQEAQRMGINLPQYITDEYNNQKNIYLNGIQQYTVLKNQQGQSQKTFITPNNSFASKDVSTLIYQKNKEKVAQGLKKIVNKVVPGNVQTR